VSLQFAILNPCPKRWTDLHGDGRERHCDLCGKSVHAIERYAPEEWDQLWRESHGRVCGFIVGESPPEPRSRRAILVGALLTAISPLMAQNGRLRIRVNDPAGGVVPGAEVSLLDAHNKPTRTMLANEFGEIAWTDLPFGESRFEVSSSGFRMQRLTVTLRNDDEVKINTTLELGSVGGPVFVELEPARTRPTAASEPKPAKRRRWLIFR